jgi:hypothetical protein
MCRTWPARGVQVEKRETSSISPLDMRSIVPRVSIPKSYLSESLRKQHNESGRRLQSCPHPSASPHSRLLTQSSVLSISTRNPQPSVRRWAITQSCSAKQYAPPVTRQPFFFCILPLLVAVSIAAGCVWQIQPSVRHNNGRPGIEALGS